MEKNEIIEVKENVMRSVFEDKPNYNIFYESIYETEDYIFYTNSKGEKKKSYVFKEYNFIECNSTDDKKILFNAFNKDSKISQPMSKCVGDTLKVIGFETKPYKKIMLEDETIKTGVLTLIKTEDEMYYATISKPVYFSILEINKNFKLPFEVQIIGKEIKLSNGNTSEQLNLVLV